MPTRVHPIRSLISVACLGALELVAGASRAGSWQTDVAYGANTPMDLYLPDTPAPVPAVVVSLHYCSGNKGHAQPWFQPQADAHGFLIITPQAGGNCFDATPARSGERANVVAMVQYAIAEHGADSNRVFAAGASSGACMTQALLAAYPEVFAAGASLAGVPAGAWTGGNAYGWSTPQQSDEQWGDRVRQAAEGHSGPWPRIQLWHGQGDTTLTYEQNWPAQVAQWTNVHGVANGASEMVQPTGAQDTWNRTSYLDDSGVVVVETNNAGSGVPHDLTGRGLWGDVVRFFALDVPGEPNPGTGGGGVGAGGSGTAGTTSAGGGGGASATGGVVGRGGAPVSTGAGGRATPAGGGASPTEEPTPTGTEPAAPGVPAMPTAPVATTPSGTASPPPASGGAPGVPAAGSVPPPAGSPGVPVAGAAGMAGADSVATGESSSGADAGCSVGPRRPIGAWLLLALAVLGLVSTRRRTG